MCVQNVETQKEVFELMGSVEHAVDGRRMQLIGRLSRADMVDDEAELSVDLGQNKEESENQ
jgi:hypothetical protein